MSHVPNKINVCLLLMFLLTACRQELDIIVPSVQTTVPKENLGDLKGMYLLNQGNMGTNKSTLDYLDFAQGIYHKNIFASRNPHVVGELGDVGNDLALYGSKLYAVINCSNFVEVMNADNAVHQTQITVPNGRNIICHNGYVYVSSYAGPVNLDPNARRGVVVKIDTVSMNVVDSCIVGYQPDGMAIYGNKLYVANSGGYRVPNYDRTVSVIDLDTFEEIKQIDVAINLNAVQVDRYGKIYVSSRGDYYNNHSKIYVIDSSTDTVTDSIPVSCADMTIMGDSLYIVDSEFSYATGTRTAAFAIYNTATHKIETENFITDNTQSSITLAYGIAVNPVTHCIYITDAKDYVTPGMLYCYSPQGVLLWSVITGDIPACMTFLMH